MGSVSGCGDLYRSRLSHRTVPHPSKKPNREDQPGRTGPRQGSLGRQGGGRRLAEAPDETVTARPPRCAHCQAALAEADLTLTARFDKVDLPKVAPVVTRVERYAGHCRCCGGTTLAPLPEGLEPGTPFSHTIVALAMYLRFVHHVSYRRLSRLLLELFGLAMSCTRFTWTPICRREDRNDEV